MAEIYNPQRALDSDWRTYFVQHKDDLFILECEEGPVTMKGRRMLLNIMLTLPLIRRARPISRDKHLLLKGIYNSSVHAQVMTNVVKTLESYGYTRDQLGHEVVCTVNDAYNMCYSHIGAYVRTIDIFSIADTILQPDAKDICTPNYGNIDDLNIKRMERDFKEQSKKVIDLLKGDDLKTNIFRAPLKCEALKLGQFHQFVLSAGPRTDNDESMFKRPVVGSFLSGMQDILDFAIESRSASKATHYNKTQISNSQYLIRRLHIHTSPVWHLYPGDCGSTTYVTYDISRKTVKYFMGKFFVASDGMLREITPETLDQVVDRTVHLRDTPTCRYTDGYCQVCGGTITNSFSKMGNVGFLANVKTGSPATQQVLSTKHLISTNAATYEIPDNLKQLFMVEQNDIYIRPSYRTRGKRLALGFVPQNLSHLNDLQYHVDTDHGNTAHFSDVKYLTIGEVMPDGSIEVISRKEKMMTDDKIFPHLSPEVLTIIRKHPEDLEHHQKITWLHLRNIDLGKPIMQCTVVNDSIRHYVRRFSTLISSDIEKYSSINDFMRDFSHLVWDRVDSHITHLSTLAKASLITSKKDVKIPVVENPDDVMFGTLGRLIPMRSIGSLLSFQGFHTVVNKPISYIIPKDNSIFDEFLGYEDLVEASRNYPRNFNQSIDV